MNRKTIHRIVAGAALIIASPAMAAPANGIFGDWRTDDGTAIIRVEQCGPVVCGKIARVLDPKAPAHDANNPDPQKRTQPLVGTVILANFTGSGAVWKNGSAYDPKAGRSYRAELRHEADGRLKVTGCVMFVCRSKYWSRVEA